jgi:peptidoglycan/LPS O-acetylase OafA/YrhL
VTPRIYWPQLDGVRTLAFFLVFLSHVGPVQVGSTTLYSHFVSWGWSGVDLFFCLSGFLITSLLLREREQFNAISLNHFLMRRVLRIWPLHFTAIVLGFLVFPLLGVFGDRLFGPDWNRMVAIHLLPFSLFLGNFSMAMRMEYIAPIVATLWSVCVEEQFYLVWGSCFRLSKQLKSLLWLLLAALCVGILLRSVVYCWSANYLHYYYNTLTRLDSIVLGCLLAFAWAYLPALKRYASASFALSLLIWGYLLCFMPKIYENHPMGVLTLFLVGLSWALFLFAVVEWPVLQRLFSLGPIASFGRLTYGMYIFHYVGISIGAKVATLLAGGEASLLFWWIKLLASLGATWAAAVISWKFIEQPFLALKQRFARVASGRAPA